MAAGRDTNENVIPLSLFNSGHAEQIFEAVKTAGVKVVMKGNSAECVLMAPEKYIQMMDEANDARLLAEASDRMADGEPELLVSQQEVDLEFGFSPSDYKDVSKIEFE